MIETFTKSRLLSGKCTLNRAAWAGQGRATKYLQIEFSFDPKVISEYGGTKRFFGGNCFKSNTFAVCMQSSLNGMLRI